MGMVDSVKKFVAFVWKDKPSMETSINAYRLNKMVDGINSNDSRIALLAEEKADREEVANTFVDFDINDDTGVMTFTRKDGTSKSHDTVLEKVAVNFSLDADNNLVLEMADGTVEKVPLSRFVDTYLFKDSSMVIFTVNGKEVSASVKNGSITLEKLESTIVSTIRGYTLDAQTAKGQAEQHANTAQSYAIGGVVTGDDQYCAKHWAERAQRLTKGGIEEGDTTDCAEYYYNQAKEYAAQAGGAHGYDGTAKSVSATDTHNLGSENVQGQLDALAAPDFDDYSGAGASVPDARTAIGEMVSNTPPGTLWSKVKAALMGLVTLGEIRGYLVNNGLCTEAGKYFLDAAFGKILQDQINSVNRDLRFDYSSVNGDDALKDYFNAMPDRSIRCLYNYAGLEYTYIISKKDARYGNILCISSNNIGSSVALKTMSIADGNWLGWVSYTSTSDFTDIMCAVSTIANTAVKIPGAPTTGSWSVVPIDHSTTINCLETILWQGDGWYIYSTVAQQALVKFTKLPTGK